MVQYLSSVTQQLAFLVNTLDVSDACSLGLHFEKYWCRYSWVANLYPINNLQWVMNSILVFHIWCLVKMCGPQIKPAHKNAFEKSGWQKCKKLRNYLKIWNPSDFGKTEKYSNISITIFIVTPFRDTLAPCVLYLIHFIHLNYLSIPVTSWVCASL